MSSQNLPSKQLNSNTNLTRRELLKRLVVTPPLAVIAAGLVAESSGGVAAPRLAAKEAPACKVPTASPAKAAGPAFSLAAKTPAPSDGLVLVVETHARIPNRADIVDPATLADYVQQMETHLSEQAEAVQARVAGGDTPLREYLENEIYALLDCLTALIIAAEKVGVIDVVREILTVDDTINYAECVCTLNAAAALGNLNPLIDDRAHYIEHKLWGQEPPKMSAELRQFAVLKSLIGEEIDGLLEVAND